MTKESPAPRETPYPNRRSWLIGFGVAEILVAGLLWAIAASQLRPAMFSSHLPLPAASDPIFAFIFYGGFGLWFLAIGIGSIQCRNWARVAMLVVSGIWLVVGAVSTLFLASLVPKIIQSQSAMYLIDRQKAYEVTMGGLVFSLILAPLIFLVFYSRRSVRATCLLEESNRRP